MAVYHLPPQAETTHEIPELKIEEFPPFKRNEKVSGYKQIATHLRKILEVFGTGTPPKVRIPTTLELAAFYHGNVLDVLDAMFELKIQGFEYVMNGLDAEILLEDPLCRRKPYRKRLGWQVVLREMTNPWDVFRGDATRHHARNPLTELFPRKGT